MKGVWPLQSNSKVSKVPKDSQVPISGVSFILTLPSKWGCDINYVGWIFKPSTWTQKLLEVNVHDHDAPPNGELAMLRPHEMIIIPIFPLDPWPPWGTLNEFQSSISHYIHQVWHILPSPNPCSLMDVNNGLPSLSPLYTKSF
jgi:hypothetical protein